MNENLPKNDWQNHLFCRDADSSDEAFFEKLYILTRQTEFDGLGWDEIQLNAFLKMQFRLQNQAYEMQFPDAEYTIVELKKMPIGCLIVERVVEIKLVNIALLPEFRSRGIGTFLMKQLQAEAKAADKPLTLHVLKTNDRAINLYQRRGFTTDDNNELYLAMRWQSS